MISDTSRKEMDFSVNHGRMHCIVQGEGDPIVLLHGALGIGSAHFREQIDEFAMSYQVIVPDLLGYGKSGRRDYFDEHFHQRDAEDVVDLVKQIGLSRIHLCGFSDGAIVAMLVACKQIDLIRSLVVIGAQQTAFDEQSMETVRGWVPVDRLSKGFQEALARSHGDPYWRQLVAEYVDAAERICQSGGKVVDDCLANITCPTLIVHGGKDPWGNLVNVENLNKSIIRSELAIFPDAGHEVQREQPEVFNARVLKFLSSY